MYEYLISYERWSEISCIWCEVQFRTTDDALSHRLRVLRESQSYGEVRELKFERI